MYSIRICRDFMRVTLAGGGSVECTGRRTDDIFSHVSQIFCDKKTNEISSILANAAKGPSERKSQGEDN